MAKQQTDEELNIKRKARRRLVGAIALTLMIVVILPMVLDSEPRPTGQDIDLRIPAPDRVGEFIPGVPASEVAEVPPAVVAPDMVQGDTAISAAASDAKADAPSGAPPVLTKRPEIENTNKSASIEGYVAQIGAYSNPETARQQLAKLKKWGFSKAYTEKIGDNTRVRVGPYPEREKAEQVRKLLEKHGLKPVVMSAR